MEDIIIYNEIIGCSICHATTVDLFPLPFAPTIHIREFISTPKFSPRKSHGLFEIMGVNIAIELYKYSRCLYVLTVWGRSGNERLGPDGKKSLLQLPM